MAEGCSFLCVSYAFAAIACEDRRACLHYLCDLFQNSVANQSMTLRIEVDHLISCARRNIVSSSLAMQRIASLLARYPNCCEKLGLLVRLIRDMEREKQRDCRTDRPASQASTKNASNEQDDVGTTNSQNPPATESSVTREPSGVGFECHSRECTLIPLPADSCKF